MVEVTASAVVPAPPEQVWELLSDTSRYDEYVVGTDEVTRSDGPAREGATYDERNTILGPWKTRTSWRVIEFDAPRRQVHVSEDLPLSSEFLVILELAPEGDATRVTFTLRSKMAGPLAPAFARLMRPGVERNNRRTVEAFAELARRELDAGTPA